MKTEEQIKAKLKKVKSLQNNKHLHGDTLVPFMLGAQIHILEWVLKDVQPRLPSPRIKKKKIIVYEPINHERPEMH